MPGPPFSITANALFVAYYASAEFGCFLALDWSMPARVLDLYAEFSCLTAGGLTPCGRSLLGALAAYGLPAIGGAEKDAMRQLALRGGDYTPTEKATLMDYCQTDVDALALLLPRMIPAIDLPRALLRGRSMIAAAKMEWAGVPIDTGMLTGLLNGWESVKDRLIASIDADYGVFDDRTCKADRWAQFLAGHNIPWPFLESGSLDLSDDTFREMARAYPIVSPMRELRASLSQLRLNELAVGSDGRNRAILSAFSAKTSRNQPSTSRFIFGPSVWFRGLIRPGVGKALAYIDFEQQEFGIAAALSGDPVMMEAYRTGDSYLAFAKQAGAVPPDATKNSHRTERDRFKICALASLYGIGPKSLGQRIGDSISRGRELIEFHQRTYPQYWLWSDAVLNTAMLTGKLQTVFGWTLNVGPDVKPNTLRNFPVQANGAEMLRLACCMTTEAGITVCAPVHDALLIEADSNEIDGVVKTVQSLMEEASRIVLNGFVIRTEAKVVRYPDRYMDDRGRSMWTKVTQLIDQITPHTDGSLPLSPASPPSILISPT
ncbi:hypothetical protein BH10PLA1_BH10PLA1_16290 [soil metagenome]